MLLLFRTPKETDSRRHFTYQFLNNVKVNKFAEIDQNIPCASRVMSILLIANGLTDRRTHTVIIVHTFRSCI